MKCAFLSRGLQVVSASGDGLIKLWTIKTSECVASLDGHIGKIWALAGLSKLIFFFLYFEDDYKLHEFILSQYMIEYIFQLLLKELLNEGSSSEGTSLIYSVK